MSFTIKVFISKIITFLIYYPLARLSYFLELLNIDIKYLHCFITEKVASILWKQFHFIDLVKLVNKFTKDGIFKMMSNAGLTKIQFSKKSPFWVTVGIKK